MANQKKVFHERRFGGRTDARPGSKISRRFLGARVLCLSCALTMTVLAGSAGATHVGISSGGGAAGPITTASAGILPQGRWGVDFGTEYLRFDTFSEDQLLEFAAEDKAIHNVKSLVQYNAGLSYGLVDGIGIHARIPYVVKSDIVESEPPDEVHEHGTAHGFGDISVHVHHRIDALSADGTGVSLTYGIKFPTGSTDDRDNDGNRFEPEFQPGSGSWDLFLGAEYSRTFRGISLDANILYTLVTEGAQSADLGDIFNFNLALSHRFRFPWGSLDGVVELNGLWKDYERIDGDRDPDSGGSILYLSPGIRLALGHAVAAYATVGLPLLQDLNGTQNEVDYRTLFGLVFSR